MELSKKEKDLYMYIHNMLINNNFEQGLHSKRWFANKFNLTIAQAYKILNIFVNRGVILPLKNKGYKINDELLKHILIYHKPGRRTYELCKLSINNNQCYVEKKIFLDDIFYAYLKSTFLINSLVTKNDLKEGIVNFLSKEHPIWQSSKKIKINFNSEIFNGISVLKISKTYDINLQLIEESQIEYNPKFFEDSYTKIY